MSVVSARLVNPPSVRLLLALGLGRAIPWLRRARHFCDLPALDASGQIPEWRYRRWIAEHEQVDDTLEGPANITVLPLARIAQATSNWVAIREDGDQLAPAALGEIGRAIAQHPEGDLFYSDEDEIDERGQRCRPRFKPDWSPDYLRSCNYIGGLLVVRRDLLHRVGPVTCDYDLALKLSEVARRIIHVPKVLYHRRRPRITDQDADALREHFRRIGLEADVSPRDEPGTFRVRYRHHGRPRVSVIIPNRDQAEMLERCLAAFGDDGYPDVEILIVENGSRRHETFALYERARQRSNVRILTWDQPFNYAAINNFAVARATGELLLFLNNDLEALHADWLDRLVELALLPGVGAVGAKLQYPDRTLQHAGVVLGMYGVAGHVYRRHPSDAPGYLECLRVPHNVAAVTGACLLMPRAVFEQIGGFDEEFGIAFNDVDLCLRSLQAGYRTIWTPDSVLIHHESKTRGVDANWADRSRLVRETDRLRQKWADLLRQGDHYFGPHFRLDRTDCCLK